jgi:hypothetical protein
MTEHLMTHPGIARLTDRCARAMLQKLVSEIATRHSIAAKW